jgi:carboxyl-terminal processing protease
VKGYHTAARWPGVAAGLCVAAALAVACTTAGGAAGAAGAPGAGPTGGTPPPCHRPRGPGIPPGKPGKAKPTTVTTIGQAYFCIFAHYYAGPVLDDRVLLAGAFAGLTQQLDRLGLDQPGATMPALTGHRPRDWDTFAAVYRRITGRLPARPALRQQVTGATMTGMVAALNDNHAMWFYPPKLPPGWPANTYGLGITTSPGADLAQGAPGEALPPLFVTAVDPHSPAARQGVRPGAIIAAVDGAPPFLGGMLTPAVISLLNQSYPQHQAVRITLRWPVTGAARTITIAPAAYRLTRHPPVAAMLLRGHIAYVAISSFDSGAGSGALDLIAGLERKVKLRGVILDLRGNGGGSLSEVAKLLGAFEHGRAWSYTCTITGTCTASYPDPATRLLHLPLAVLTDRNCESACDDFAGAVKDLHLGTLIGTRTAGLASGGTTGYLLDDGSVLFLPNTHLLSANHEIINGIGVAPRYYLPYTAKDLATGHDPDITKALALLGR